MRKLIPVVSLLLLVVFGAFGQTENTVRSIRKAYSEVADAARRCETDDEGGRYGGLVMNELVINKREHQWRAVGIFREIYRFFYKGGDTEKHLYPDQLVMVKVERHSSNRVYYVEMLYDDAGRLVFYFQKAENDELAPVERRIYFSIMRPVRVVEDGKQRDRLSANDIKTAQSVAAEALRIKDLFQRSIKL